MGTKGTIRKIVRFRFVEHPNGSYYNIAFGDKVEGAERINDLAISNNGDIRLIIHTLSNILFDFFKQKRDAIIYIGGSTPARSRLYQIQISANLSVIQEKFDVFGVRNGQTELFKININYSAFLFAPGRMYKFDI